MSENENVTDETKQNAADDALVHEQMTAEAAAAEAGAAEAGETGEIVDFPEPPSAEAQIAELEAALHEAKEDRLRAIAEADNTRKRTQRELDNARKFAVEPLAKELLNIADNIKRALDAVDEAKAEQNSDLKNMRAAVEVMDKELHAAFEKHKIAIIDPTDAPFDPNVHQAMFEVPTSDMAPGTVMQVVTRGYQMHDRLLRPAMVGVAKAAG